MQRIKHHYRRRIGGCSPGRGWMFHAGIASVLIGFVLAGCSSSRTDPTAIRDLIDTGAAFTEAHDIAGLLDLATEDIRAMPMNLDRKEIKGVLWRTFNHYGPLAVLYPRPAITIEEGGRHASANVIFLIVKKSPNIPGLDRLRDDPRAWVEAIGETADLYRLELNVVKTGGKWRVHRATLERFTGLGFG